MNCLFCYNNIPDTNFYSREYDYINIRYCTKCHPNVEYKLFESGKIYQLIIENKKASIIIDFINKQTMAYIKEINEINIIKYIYKATPNSFENDIQKIKELCILN